MFRSAITSRSQLQFAASHSQTVNVRVRIPLIGLLIILVLWVLIPVTAAEPPASPLLPLLFEEDFEQGAVNWAPTDPAKWKVTRDGENHVYHLLGKSDYTPPHRSPHSLSLRKDLIVGQLEFTARVKTLQKPMPHRDMCLFFGYQDAAHFYYVHLGERTDPHANQIFIVNGADRVKISTKTSPGTPWKEDYWHLVKLVHDPKSGLIQVYFDDMQAPMMEARDTTFTHGQIGLGSFDDLGQWDDISVRGVRVGLSK